MKAQLKKLVAQEELDQVLEILLDYLETHNANLYNVGVHLSARYRHWKEKTLKGIQEKAIYLNGKDRLGSRRNR